MPERTNGKKKQNASTLVLLFFSKGFILEKEEKTISWLLDEIYQNLTTVHRTLSKLQSSFGIFLGSRRVVVASVASFLQDCVDIPLFFL